MTKRTIPPFEPAPRPTDLPNPRACAAEAVARACAGFPPEQENALGLYVLAALPPAAETLRLAHDPAHNAVAALMRAPGGLPDGIAGGLPDGIAGGLAGAAFDGARRGVRDYLAACHRAGIRLPGLAEPADPAVDPASLAALGFPAVAPFVDASGGVVGPGFTIAVHPDRIARSGEPGAPGSPERDAPGSPERDAWLRREAPWLYPSPGAAPAGPTTAGAGEEGQRPPGGARFAVGPLGHVHVLRGPDREGSAGGSGPADPA